MVQRQLQSHQVQRLPDPGPNLVCGKLEILQPEGHVVADPGQHHLRLRVLHHQPDPAPLRLRRRVADPDPAGLLTFVSPAEHPGQGMQQGRLAGPGGPQQQHPLPGFDTQIEVAYRPGPAAGMAPAPALDPDPCRAHSDVRTGLAA